MRNKIFFLGIISSCVLTINGWADYGSSNATPQKRPCYPASNCTSNPNLFTGNGQGYGGNYYGGDNNNNMNPAMNGLAGPRVLQTTSTEQFVGVVKSLNRVSLPNQTQVQVVLQTDKGDVLVILGPASFLDRSKVKLGVGDKVTITGYRINVNGNVVVMAAQVLKNGVTLQLLDENRKPLWGTESDSTQQQGYSSSYYN